MIRLAIIIRPFDALIHATLAALLCLTAARADIVGDVRLFELKDEQAYPEALAPGAIQYACAGDRERLFEYFRSRGLPFENRLVRKKFDYRFCHVFHEPTLTGFEASADDEAAAGFFGSVEAPSFIGGRKPIGDGFDILNSVLAKIQRPIKVSWSVTEEFEPAVWRDALERRFGDSPHDFALRPHASPMTHPWAQDFVKAGYVGGRSRILVPRRLFEGRREDGETFTPLLDSFADERFARSKLSWEGGDLQFVRDPRDPSKLVLVHGGSARDYWAASLEAAEFSYVLRVEFGADRSIDLGEAGPHADFLAAFLPADKIALVSRPVHGDPAAARAAVEVLLKHFGKRAPPALARLALVLRDAAAGGSADEILGLTARARREIARLEAPLDLDLVTAFDAHVARYCPDRPIDCVQGEGRRRMLRVDPEIYRRSSDAAVDDEFESLLPQRMLALVDSQFLPGRPAIGDVLNRKADELRELGFKVVRVPYLYSPELRDDWAGVSYLNLLAFDRALFVPAFGLGEYEERIFRGIERGLGGRYRVEPTPARLALLSNGGVHCVVGIVREPPPRRWSGVSSD